jgi:hypothetical protein
MVRSMNAFLVEWGACISKDRVGLTAKRPLKAAQMQGGSAQAE